MNLYIIKNLWQAPLLLRKFTLFLGQCSFGVLKLLDKPDSSLSCFKLKEEMIKAIEIWIKSNIQAKSHDIVFKGGYLQPRGQGLNPGARY